LIQENKLLKQQIQNLRQNQNNKSAVLKEGKTCIDYHLHEADKAMERYNEKLRKEISKYAKQKQSKRK
jgi:ribosomal protein L7/L12